MLPRTRSGFTLLEALVVILIVGILAAVGTYGFNVSRSMNRDAKRISDVSVIRAALTQYWLQTASYPVQKEAVALGRPGTGTDQLAATGFLSATQQAPSVFLDRMPIGPKTNEYYLYHGSARGYSLKFVTERSTVYGPAGVWYAHVNGVDREDTEK